VTAGEDRLVKTWDAGSGKELAAFAWGVGRLRAVACAPDGLTAAAAGEGRVVVWDLDQAECSPGGGKGSGWGAAPVTLTPCAPGP
jgi:hypothetical protein